jgi:hypothetical protein
MSNPTKIPSYKMLALDQIEPYGANARTHSAAQVAQIAASIERFGFTNPLLIDEFHRLIAGHGRRLAAQQLGWREVPVMVISGLSDTERRALVIADNKLALNAGWDFELLSSELRGLADDNFNLDLTGFGQFEIEGMLLPQVDPTAEWAGMPEYDQQELAYQTIRVNFRDAAAVQAFAKLIGQTLTPKTRGTWYPQEVRESFTDKAYVTVPEAGTAQAA